MIRSLLAAVLTTALPTMVGARWFRGPAAARYGLGSLVGVGALGAGAVLGAMAGLLLPGAAAGVVVAWVLGPRLALDLGTPADEAGDRLLRVLLGVVGVVGLALLAMSLFRPVAWWDGWMTWSLKAKSLALTGDYSGAVFAEPIYAQSHPDYPPLLSAWQAVAYVLQGTSEVSWPTQLQLAWLWTAGAAGLVTLAARWGRGAALVALAWAAAPHLVRQQMSGYADVPMALFLVAGAALLVRRGHPRQAWLAGGLLAVGALIKLEGLPLALLVAAPMLLLPDRRADALRAGAVVVGAFLPWAAFVRLQGFTNDLAAGLGETAPGLATMAGRVPVVAFWVARELLWPLRWSLLTLSCVAVLVLVRRAPWAMVASAALSLGAFALVYVTSPLDFDFHIRFSMDRVVTAPLGFLAVATASAVGAWSSRAPSRTGGSSRPEPAAGGSQPSVVVRSAAPPSHPGHSPRGGGHPPS